MQTAIATAMEPKSATTEMEALFSQIDALELPDRLLKWKEARRTAPFTVCVERDRLALESWKETEGEDIEIRRAKLFKKIAEGLPIGILDFDLIVGRVSSGLLDAVTQIDIAGDYIPGLWEDQDDLALTANRKEGLSKADREVLREAARYFHPRSAPTHVLNAWRRVVGTWAEDMEEARFKDPWQSAAFFPATVMAPRWDKVLAKGLRSFINGAKAKIEWFLETEQTNIDKLYFWQASIMTCEAAIAYAQRYAHLAREMAERERIPQERGTAGDRRGMRMGPGEPGAQLS